MSQKRTKAGVQISFDDRDLIILRNNLNILTASIRAGDFFRWISYFATPSGNQFSYQRNWYS
jgi:hypothetical protein